MADDTFTSFASTPLVDRLPDGSAPRYTTRSPCSQPLALGPGWSGWRFPCVQVSHVQAAAMLADAARLDPRIDHDPGACQLASALVFLEGFTGAGNDGNLLVGASMRDFMVLQGTDPRAARLGHRGMNEMSKSRQGAAVRLTRAGARVPDRPTSGGQAVTAVALNRN